MKRKKRVIAFVSALLMLMYGTIPSFSAFADEEENIVTEESLAFVPAEEATTENAIGEADTETPPMEEETFFYDTVAEDLTDPIEENHELVAENLPAVASEGGFIDGYQDYVEPTPRWEDFTPSKTSTQPRIASNVLDNATMYVPYSYLLTPANASTNIPTTEPATTDPTPSPTEPATNPPVNNDNTVTIPAGLELGAKGSETQNGILYYTSYFSDNSVMVEGADTSASSITIPSALNGHPVRAIDIHDVEIQYEWSKYQQITVPSGIAFVRNTDITSFEVISASEAVALLKEKGITLVIGSGVSSNNNYPNQDAGGVLEDHNGYNMNTPANTTPTYDTSTYTTINGRLPEGLNFYPESFEGYNMNTPANTTPTYDTSTYTTINGRLPEGLNFYPESFEIYGVPMESGIFIFTLDDLYDKAVYTSESGETTIPQEYDVLKGCTFELTVLANGNYEVYEQTDEGYAILQSVGIRQGNCDFVVYYISDIVYRSQGEFGEFVNLWLNGQLLERGVDYDAESGSTVMTIYAKTFKNKANLNSVNTIAAEFRTTDPDSLNTINDTNGLRVTSQNFRFSSDSTDSSEEEIVYESTNSNDNVTVSSNNSSIVSSSSNNSSSSYSSSSSSSSSSSNSNSSSTTSSNANTADNTPVLLYVIIGILSMLGVGLSFPRKHIKP